MASRAPITIALDINDKIWNTWFSETGDTLSAPNWDDADDTPAFTGLTGTFTANISFVRHGKMLFFDLLISPTGAIISTLGTTYFLLPSLNVNGGSTVAIAALGYGTLNAFEIPNGDDWTAEPPVDLGQGIIRVNTLKAYTPDFNTDKKVSVTGWVRIQGL